MNPVSVNGLVNEQHVLTVSVPPSVQPGPVTVIIVPAPPSDDADAHWMTGISRAWADDLSDTRQDIYTLNDGEPVDAAG